MAVGMVIIGLATNIHIGSRKGTLATAGNQTDGERANGALPEVYAAGLVNNKLSLLQCLVLSCCLKWLNRVACVDV
ncbi:hypothetical protein L1987_71779 [Smallanthus sonchifolius]|uniref:Uncharacterized protein n=1 Tax=Smallanthus sonchifolius TaxID=185202 RepID=A0ACB9AU18_9ASTR|nr:hypothetical protein L1987_71779 [Smallanthus sonchifolius]